MRTPSLPILFGRRVQRVHCLGVGGMGVAPLAIYLARSGWTVSGEDDGMNPEVAKLLGGAGVALGTAPKNCELVVRSSAIPKGHPSFVAAVAEQFQSFDGGRCLQRYPGKQVGGCLRLARQNDHNGDARDRAATGFFPAGYVAGGLFSDQTPPANVGSNEWVVAEVDESDGTIDGFSPEITVIVNFDWDHPDRYQSPAELEAAFRALCARTKGSVLVSDACAQSLRIAPNALTFGRSGTFTGTIAAEREGRMTLLLGGRFRAAEVGVGTTGNQRFKRHGCLCSGAANGRGALKGPSFGIPGSTAQAGGYHEGGGGYGGGGLRAPPS